MSMARFWRDQGKPQQARELFAPVLRLVYGRLRHAGPEGGEGAARRAGAVSRSVGPFSISPVFLKPQKNLFEIRCLCLTPCHFDLSLLCGPATVLRRDR
jgi:hypothetical protein